MSARRQMGDMIAEVAEGAMVAGGSVGVRVTRIEMKLPIEIAWTGGALFADFPRTVTRTQFDAPPSRLHLTWEARP